MYCNNVDDWWSDIADKGRTKAHRKRTYSYIDRPRAASCATISILIAYNVRAFNIAQTNSHGYWRRTRRWLYLRLTGLRLIRWVGFRVRLLKNIYKCILFFTFSTSTAPTFSPYRWDVFTRFVYIYIYIYMCVCVCVLLCIAEVPADHPQCGPRPDFRLPTVRPKTRVMDSSPHAYVSNLHLAATASVVSYRSCTQLLSERKKNNFDEQSEHIIIQTGPTRDRSQTKHQFSHPKFNPRWSHLYIYYNLCTSEPSKLRAIDSLYRCPRAAHSVIIYCFMCLPRCIRIKWSLVGDNLSTC
jgi:hypothetical protein